MDSLGIRGAINGLIGPPNFPTTASKFNTSNKTNTFPSKIPSFNFNFPFLKTMFLNNGSKAQNFNKGVALNDVVSMEEGETDESGGQNGNWVLKILHVRSLWEEERKNEQRQNGNFDDQSATSSSCNHCDLEDSVCDMDDDVEKFDKEMFKKMSKKVSLNEAKLFAQLSYLGNLAYDIPRIKSENLLKRYNRLRYVTSSIEKRDQLAGLDNNEQLAKSEVRDDEEEEDNSSNNVRTSAAYEIAANAASYLHSRTRSILKSSKEGEDEENDRILKKRDINSEMASLMATTDSVTAVVAAKEEVKQAVADDLNSIISAPCEWFVCDDDKNATRFFVIQGSETLASWQANLLFEPVQFEGLDVFVHRGIYEAAKGMYQQMFPEIQAYMKTHGNRAKFRFTGHSLGGSLSMFINLMLLMRGEVPYASLLPVVTFGSPCVMCGGDELFRKLALPKSHVQAIVMHRDIVPRAFSCHYPRPAAQLLKAVNGGFRNLPCLNSQKLLYAPMGEMIILQPDAKFSPQHELLPSGSGLYRLTCKAGDAKEAEKRLRAAKNTFLNTPHPLEILSDRAAYGNGGTVQRDHDMNSYLKCIRGVIRHEHGRIRKVERERRRKVVWPSVKPSVVETGIVVGSTLAPRTGGWSKVNFAGAFRSGRESVRRFSRLVASQHMHLLVLVMFPARVLLLGAYNVIPR